MKNRKTLCLLCLVPFLSITMSRAATNSANLYQIRISGTSWYTNSAGAIIPHPFNNATILQEAARRSGGANSSAWGLAYHFRGNDLGDTIDIIDRNTGTVLDTVYGLYFGEDFGRTSILSASHRQLKRLEYVYTDQNSHSIGSALLTEYFFFDANGNTNNTIVLGQMQWVVTPDASHDRSQICTASFSTVRPWTFR